MFFSAVILSSYYSSYTDRYVLKLNIQSLELRRLRYDLLLVNLRDSIRTVYIDVADLFAVIIQELSCRQPGHRPFTSPN